MFKKQIVIEIEGTDRDTVRRAFEVVHQKLIRYDFIDQVRLDVAAKGIEFDDDLSIQTFTKTFS